MKFLMKFGMFCAGVVVLIGAAAVITPNLTKNHGTELAMAIDNVNPAVKIEDVYASTSVKPIRHFIGGGGEKEYVYELATYNNHGQMRKLTFDSQWVLKPNRYLKINTKGQNVETWEAIDRAEVPSGVRQNLMMS